jgi:hypothetical protein
MYVVRKTHVKHVWSATEEVGFRPVEKAEHQGCCGRIPHDFGWNRNLVLDSGTPTNRNENRNVQPRPSRQPRQLVVASPLLVLSLRCPLIILSRQLVVALPLAVLLMRHPLVNSSRQLVVASPLLVLLLRPAPPSRPLVAPGDCCVASRRADLSSLVVSPLVVSLRQLVVALSYLVVLSLYCPLILSSYWLVVALPVLAPPSRPLVAVHHRHHRRLSNAAAAIEHHRHRRH